MTTIAERAALLVNPADYDTKEGIKRALASHDLSDLETLVRSRQAAYKKAPSLHLQGFCIMGRWMLDGCGQCGVMCSPLPEELGACPDVMTIDELRLFMRGTTYSYHMVWPFAPSFAKCSECGGGWTLRNAHLFHTELEHTEYSLEHKVGEKLKDLIAIPELEGRSHYRISHDSVYSNVYTGVSRCGTSNKLWHRVEKEHVIESGDRAIVEVRKFVHSGCYRSRVHRESRQEMLSCFTKAGFPQVQLISTPNGYDKKMVTPWYTAQVDDASPITIGWCKRVINIDWSTSGINLSDAFDHCDVTKGPHFIHACSYEDATRYLETIVTAVVAANSIKA